MSTRETGLIVASLYRAPHLLLYFMPSYLSFGNRYEGLSSPLEDLHCCLLHPSRIRVRHAYQGPTKKKAKQNQSQGIFNTKAFLRRGIERPVCWPKTIQTWLEPTVPASRGDRSEARGRGTLVFPLVFPLSLLFAFSTKAPSSKMNFIRRLAFFVVTPLRGNGVAFC